VPSAAQQLAGLHPSTLPPEVCYFLGVAPGGRLVGVVVTEKSLLPIGFVLVLCTHHHAGC